MIPEMVKISDRLALRYAPGIFSFTQFDALATDEELFNLAQYLNMLQEDEAQQIVRVRTHQFM